MTEEGRAARSVDGAALMGEATGLLWRTRGVKRYLPLPALMTGLLYLGLMAWLGWWLAAWRAEPFAWEFWGGFGAWLAGAADWVLAGARWLLLIPALVAIWVTFTPVALVVASPFNDLLSERVERALGDFSAPAPADRRQWWRWLARSLAGSAKLAALQVAWTVVLLPLWLVPGVGWLAFFALGALCAGLGFSDVALARRGWTFGAKRVFWRRWRWELLGIGLVAQAAMLVPGGGLIIMPVGVAAATMLCSRAGNEGA